MGARTVLEVEFNAAAAGSAEMTWGQRAMWQDIQWMGEESDYFNFSKVISVPEGRGLADVHVAVRALLERHEGLRTRFPSHADPHQEVHGSGTLAVELLDASNRDLDRTADELCSRLRGHPFRHDVEYPLRIGLILAGGQPRRLVLIVSHLLTDGTGWRLLVAELGELLAGKNLPVDEKAWGPLALSAFEQSAVGARLHAASMRHWREELSVVPPSIFDHPARPPETPRYRGLTMESPALAVAADRIATALRSTRSTVLLTATAAIIAHYTGHGDVTLQLIVGNRWERHLSRIVAPMTENGIFTISLDGLSFSEALRLTWKQAFACYQAAAYDPQGLNEVLDSVRRLRGAYIDCEEAFFNDVRRRDRWEALPLTNGTEDEVRRLRSDTRIEMTDGWDRLGLKAFFYVRYAPDRAIVHLQVDTAYISGETARLMLHGMETLLVCAAYHPLALSDTGEITGIPPARRGEDWIRVGPGWIRLPAVNELLARCASVAAAAVFLEPHRSDAGTDRSLVAFVVPTDHGMTVERLHDDLFTLLGRRTDIMTPGYYMLCATAPLDRTDIEEWRAQPVLRAGSGRREPGDQIS
jgi:hypothetical protein